MRNKYFALLICCAVTAACELPDRPDDRSSQAQAALTAPTTVPPTSGFGDPGIVTTIDSSGNVNWVGGAWYVPLGLQAGDVVGLVSVVVRDNGASNGHTSDGNNVIALLVSRTASGDTTIGSASSNGSGMQQTLPITPTGGAYAVKAGDDMLLKTFGLKGGALPGPSTVPSMTGIITAAPPVRPVTRIVYPPSSFAVDSANLGFRFISLNVPSGSTVIGASIAASCLFAGMIITCARYSGISTWDLCSPAVACSGNATATLDVALAVTDTQHVDIGLYSSVANNTPTVAVASYR